MIPTHRLLLQPAFDPFRLPGLVLYLDASVYGSVLTAGVPSVDGDAVDTWRDLSGKGNHATQATAAAKPLCKLAIVNGRAVLRFDGGDDKLNTTNNLPGGSGGYTITVVQAPDASTGQYGWIGWGPASANNHIGFRQNPAIAGYTDWWYSNDLSVSVAITALQFRILTSRFDGVTRTILRDGLQLASDLPVGKNTTASIATIGASSPTGEFFDGDIAAILVCEGGLSNTNLRKLHRWAGRRYNIAVS